MKRIIKFMLLVAFALPVWAENVTVCDGDARNEFVPVYGYWIDTQGVESQMIYPSSTLGLTGGGVYKIDAITFHSTDTVPASLAGATVIVRMGETYNTTISTRSEMVSNRNEMDVVYQGHLAIDQSDPKKMTIDFQTAYVYQGNNILVDIYVATPSENCNHCYWLGETQVSDTTAWNNKDGAQKFLPKMTISYSVFQEQVVNFGKKDINPASPYSDVATITNITESAVTATWDASKAGSAFTFAAGSVTVAAGGSYDIPVTFNPTAATSYTDYIVVNINNYKNDIIRLTGIGDGGENAGPVATRDANFFKSIPYTWREWQNGDNATTGPTGTQHTSNLSEIATNPDQIIAMLKEVYTNKSIPGNYKRGYTSSGTNDHDSDVNYSGVGTLKRTGTAQNASSCSWQDTYGWGIEGEVLYGGSRTYSGTSGYYHWYMNPNQYKPDDEGVTLMLVEMVDTFKPVSTGGDPTHDYAKLRNYFKESIKSVRIVTEAKRTGTGQAAGTLFKIDCDKMNNFFFIAKGQVLWFKPRTNSSTTYYYNTNYDYNSRCYLYRNQNYSSSSNIDQYLDRGLSSGYLSVEPALFCHMFEQFSPSTTVSTSGTDTSVNPDDLYQAMINMTSFGVEHDCPNVPYVNVEGHHFKMYNSDYSGDCADVNDMMFFVPDYRMMDWAANDGSGLNRGQKNQSGTNRNQDYTSYNRTHQPKIGLYVISQDAITGQQVGTNEVYQLTLTWDSNLDDYLPGDQQLYQLFQVVVNEDGVEEYIPVYYTKVVNGEVVYTDKDGNPVSTPVPIELTLNPNDSKTYTEVYIPMQESSQQVSFAVRGQDATQFLDLKTSNTQSYVIPGLDKNELVSLTDATHYSRFNPETVKNCYSNRISVANTALGLVNNNITDGENGTKLTIIRSHNETVNGTTTTVEEPIAYITFSNHGNNNRKITVTMANQANKTEFPEGKSTQNSDKYAGYHANNGNVEGNSYWSQSYYLKNGYVDFRNLNIYDNFVVDVADNSHPNSYTYKLTSNYAGTPSSVYLSIIDVAEAIQANGAVFYACTWNNGQAQKWVKGESMNDDNTLFRFSLLKDNFIFCRMNPAVENEGNEPGWDFRWNQSSDMITSDHLGKTYYVYNVDMTSGNWDNNNTTPEYAHSNDLRIPVYKTDSKINNVYTLAEVDAADEAAGGDTFENEDLTFEEKLQYSSKKDILRYDVYRWGETEKRFIINKVTDKDNEEEDLSPDGQADNQDGWYTTKMNAESQESVTVPQGSTNKWASFLDNVPENKPAAEAFTYAPVVETFSTGKTSDNANKDRTDYNTYGGPLQNASIGKLEISADKPVMSDYTWSKDGKKYTYYNIELSVDTKDIPDGYEIYKIRVWREADESMLGEEYPELATKRVKPTYKFEEISYTETDKIGRFWNAEGLKFGSDEKQDTVTGPDGQKIVTYNLGTFGARKVGGANETGVVSSIDVGFFARIYFTRSANLTTPSQLRASGDPLPADGKYYMVEAQCNYTIQADNIITAVNDISGAKQIVGVSYVNTIGQVSSTPWQGVNVVVTRYNDGSVSTQKMMK